MKKSITNNQLRKLIKEEVSKLEGYHQMTLEEKQELEEGIMDFFRRTKANIAGSLASGVAKAKGLGSSLAGGARAVGSLAKAGFTGKSQPFVKGPTVYDTQLIKGLTVANSLVQSYFKPIKKAFEKLADTHQNAVSAIEDAELGSAEQYKSTIIAALQDEDKIEELKAALEKAKAGDLRAIGALAVSDEDGSFVGRTPSRVTVKPEEEETRMAAEAISEALVRKLLAKNRRKI